MSGRQQKKMRKVIAAGARQLQDQMMATMDEKVRALIKPRPRWLPAPIYRQLVKLIINIPTP